MNSKRSFPNHWDETTLAEFRKNSTPTIDPEEFPDEKFELYSMQGFDESSPEIVEGSEVGSRKKSLDGGIVLLSRINPRINRVWIVEEQNDYRQIGSTEWVLFETTSQINKSYLKYFLQNPEFRNYLQMNTSGVGSSLMRVNRESIDKYPIPLPPLEEQKKIVSKIEELLSKIESGVKELETTKQKLSQYRRVLLEMAIEGKLTEDWRQSQNEDEVYISPEEENNIEIPSSWELGEVSEFYQIVPGKAFSSSSFQKDGVPVIKIGNVSHGEFKQDHSDHLPKKFLNEHTKYVVEPGSLLLALTRPITDDKVKVCKYPKNRETALLNQRVCKVSEINNNRLELFMYFIQSDYFKTKIANDCSETLQPNLSSVSLRKFKFPMPPKEEQEKIIDKVERHMTIIQDLKQMTIQNLQRSKHLQKSILNQAFSGQLLSPDTATDLGKEVRETQFNQGKKQQMEQTTLQEVIKSDE